MRARTEALRIAFHCLDAAAMDIMNTTADSDLTDRQALLVHKHLDVLAQRMWERWQRAKASHD